MRVRCAIGARLRVSGVIVQGRVSCLQLVVGCLVIDVAQMVCCDLFLAPPSRPLVVTCQNNLIFDINSSNSMITIALPLEILTFLA